MKFIAINGSTCSGKSSILKQVLKEREHTFGLSYDALKRSFSQYAPATHFGDVHRVMLSMLTPLSATKYDIICDSGLYREWRSRLFQEARSLGYDVVELSLECDYDVLAARFDERVAEARANPAIHVSNTSKERFKELHDIFQANKNTTARSFRTDEQSTEEIVAEVLKLFTPEVGASEATP